MECKILFLMIICLYWSTSWSFPSQFRQVTRTKLSSKSILFFSNINDDVNVKHNLNINSVDSKIPDEKKNNLSKFLIPVGVVAALAALTGISHNIDISSIFDKALSEISDLGPLGYLYFAGVSQ
jgi:hypothetical protein